jgi:hypothetical protein
MMSEEPMKVRDKLKSIGWTENEYGKLTGKKIRTIEDWRYRRTPEKINFVVIDLIQMLQEFGTKKEEIFNKCNHIIKS